MKNKITNWIILSLIIFLFCVFTGYHIDKYRNMKTMMFDFGYNNNLAYNTFKGNIFYTSFYRWNQLDGRNYNSLGDHLFFTLPCYSAISIIFNHPIVLNLTQLIFLLLSILLL